MLAIIVRISFQANERHQNDFDGELNPEFWRHKAETSQKLSCPSCGAPLPESWPTDDVTSDSDGNEKAGPPRLSISCRATPALPSPVSPRKTVAQNYPTVSCSFFQRAIFANSCSCLSTRSSGAHQLPLRLALLSLRFYSTVFFGISGGCRLCAFIDLSGCR